MRTNRFMQALLIVTSAMNALGQALDEGPADGTFTVRGEIIAPDENRTGSAYEQGFRERIDALVSAQTWSIGGDVGYCGDNGKKFWSALLAEMYNVRNNETSLRALINNQGEQLQKSNESGSFVKAFSCPGYTWYFLQFQNYLSEIQKGYMHSALYNRTDYNCGTAYSNTGWEMLMRPDRKMDPIYAITEKNSENYSWMSRTAGYLLADYYADANKPFFETFLTQWVRALFNAGRVEWDSNNYFGFCFQSVLVLYEFAKDPEIKKMAQAICDWMIIAASLHHLDGYLVGPDVRAKSDDYIPFSGHAWPYLYWYFGESSCPVDSLKKALTAHQAGYVANSSYRIPQVALDIALRNFSTPVEMHNAKPFYQIDFESYADWKGNTQRSRRFEFETLYLNANYTLGSVATYVPDGRFSSSGGIDCFSEEREWMLGVKGNGKGAIKIVGKTGRESVQNGKPNAFWGRNPYEQIGQYRNVMVRLIKGDEYTWVLIPKSVNAVWDGDRLFADVGHDVYAAFSPYNAAHGQQIESGDFTIFPWEHSGSDLWALVLEVGTKAEHGGLEQFKTAVKNSAQMSEPVENQFMYVSTLGRSLKMEHTGLDPNGYEYWDKTPQPVNHTPAGLPPKVWCDNQLLDYSKWQSYHVVSGENIVEQNWGSGAMTAAAGGKGMQIIVNPSNGKVEYRSFSGTVPKLRKELMGGKNFRYATSARSAGYCMYDLRGRLMASVAGMGISRTIHRQPYRSGMRTCICTPEGAPAKNRLLMHD